MDDYVIDEKVPIRLRKELLKQLELIQGAKKTDIDEIRQQLLSENFIKIHIGLYRLSHIVYKEYEQEHFPIEFSDDPNPEFVQFLIDQEIVTILIRLIQLELSIQSQMDATHILSCCMNGEPLQAQYVIQSGYILCLTQLLRSKYDLLAFTGLVSVMNGAKLQKCFCKCFLNGDNEELVFRRYRKENQCCLKTLFQLCTKRPHMKFKQIKKTLTFLAQIILNERSLGLISKAICIITGKWIPLPPLKKKHFQRIQLFLDLNLIQRLKQLFNQNLSQLELLQIIMTNLIFMLSGTPEQCWSVINTGILLDVITLLDCKDETTVTRCIYMFRQFANTKFGAQYLVENQTYVSNLLRRYTYELCEQNLMLIADIFQRVIMAADIQFLQNLIDQQIIRITLKNIRCNLSFPNVNLNCKTLDILKYLFDKAPKDSKEFQNWRAEFQRVGGPEILLQLSSKAQVEKSMPEFFDQ